jgi:hypothetical protein
MSEPDLVMIENVRNLIDKNGEPLVFTIFCDESFVVKQLYAELRSNPSGSGGFLYYLITGRMDDENGLFRAIQKRCAKYEKYEEEDEEMWRLDCIDILKQFDYAALLKKEEMTATDFKKIMSLLEANPLPDVVGKLIGLDGFDVLFQNFIGCRSTYEYWVYPPQGYEHLGEIINIVCKYLPEKYRQYLYV